MINIVIFDPAETAGGGFSRAVELAAELPEFNYLFITYKPFNNLHSGKRPLHYKAVRLFSFFNPMQSHRLHKIVKKKITNKILARIFSFTINAILAVNKMSLLAQLISCTAWQKIDLVQSNNGLHFLPYTLSRLKKVKLIYYFRDLQYFAHLPKRILQHGDKLIFVGKRLLEQYQIQLNLPQERCQVIHSPFDVYARIKSEPEYEMDTPRQLKQSGKKIIVCSSRICFDKGQHVIIEALRQLVTTWPELTLLLVGEAAKNQSDQRYLRNLKHKVKDYRLAEQVIFLGHRTDPLHVLQYADVAVQAPTYFEALAGSLVESLQLGVPTISADIGGASEVLIEGKTGFLFTPGDYDALARIIDQILRDPIKVIPIIEQGKKHALENWSPRKISAQMRAIYSSARSEQ